MRGEGWGCEGTGKRGADGGECNGMIGLRGKVGR